MPLSDDDILQQLYRLRTHPFKPTIGPNGQPIESDVLTKTLDPYKDPRHISYFYNLYQWHSKDVFQGIAKNHGFQCFRKQTGDKPLLILISGYNSTGRRSLAKLLLRQIHTSHTAKPITVEVPLTGNKPNIYARDLATAFVDHYLFEENEPTEERLRNVIEDSERKEQTNPGTGFLPIFPRFKTFVRHYCARPIVFVITGVDLMRGWRRLYDLLSPLANYIVVITPCNDEAKVGRDNLPRRLDFGAVTASKLDHDRAEEFLQLRLAAERLPALPEEERLSLKPFKRDALEALFAPGAKSPASRVTWHIGWIINTLSLAFDEHLRELKHELENIGDDVAHIPEQKTWISAQAILEYMKTDKKKKKLLTEI